jgi:Mg2+/citrate symporter
MPENRKGDGKMEKQAYIVTYGETSGISSGGKLNTILVSDASEVREMARSFVHNFPDEIAPYLDDIDTWSTDEELLLVHWDDDTFYFSAVPAREATEKDMAKFDAFNAAHTQDDGDLVDHKNG